MLSMFHFSEFLAIAITNPSTLSVRSYVLDNGWEYKLAAMACWVEYLVEFYFFPGYFSPVFCCCLSSEVPNINNASFLFYRFENNMVHEFIGICHVPLWRVSQKTFHVDCKHKFQS